MVQTLDVRDLRYEVRKPDSTKNLVRKLLFLTCDCSNAKNDWKPVLDGVSLQVHRGEMMAIMGSSGSGKTSLLDVIAGRHETGSSVKLSGDVLLDGVPRTRDLVHNSVAYVRQDDRLIGQLTVRETLEFVAALRLPSSMPWEEKAKHVESVVQELALWHVIDQPVGSVEKRGISGGERRRVSIGVQMLLNPQLLLLDEPTSGLDAFTAMQLTELLFQLSRSGRIILMTVHQPRSAIFRHFDKLLLLSAGGRTVYCGNGNKTALEYFNSIGYCCPKLSNPADYLVDLATVDLHSDEQEVKSRGQVDWLVTEFQRRSAEQKSVMWTGPDYDEGCKVDSGPVGPTTDTLPDVHVLPQGDGAGVFRQFLVLCWRTWLTEFRSVAWQLQLFIAALWISVELGLVYYKLGLDQRGVRDRISLVYSSLAIYPFMVLLDTVAKLHASRRHFFYEIEDGMYGSGPMYFAKLACESPFNLVAWVCFVPIFYWMCDLKTDILSFVYTSLLVLLVVYVSRSAANAVASAIHSFQVRGVYNAFMNAMCCIVFASDVREPSFLRTISRYVTSSWNSPANILVFFRFYLAECRMYL